MNCSVHSKFDKTVPIDTNWYLEEISYFKEGIGKLQNDILGSQVLNANFLIEFNGTLLAIESKSVSFDSKEYQVLHSHEKTEKNQRNHILSGIKKFFSRREDS
ncbi:YxiG family protein [Bacillus vallismortis]|uniref:YxiG family protein n=1 Tax=Bacillus vallismortis TaxID=72361 RepID=UPI003CC6736E